jgi:hypothetical protein
MTHFRTGGKLTHAGCEMLPDGEDIEYIEFASIQYKESEEVSGRTEKGVWVGYFNPNPYTNLPMILNATNRKRIARLSGIDDIDMLKNFAVRLTKEKTRDVQDGGDTFGLRISKIPAKAPASKPKPELTEAAFEKAAEFLLKNSMDDLKKSYIVSADMEKRLIQRCEDLTQKTE